MKMLSKIICRAIYFFEKIYCLLIKSQIEHGINFALRKPKQIIFPENIKIGDNVYINKGLTALAYEKIVIGDYCIVGPNVSLLTSGHDPYSSGIDLQNSKVIKKIKIGKSTWLSANVIVLPGVSIGDNTVIGAGSVVTKNIPANSIAAGVPCRVIKNKSE